MDIYRGTQESVNTFYAMLERATGVCEPYKLAKSMGVELTYPKGDATHLPERVPTFTLGIAGRQPAGDGRGLRDLRRPRPALRLAPGDLDRGLATATC